MLEAFYIFEPTHLTVQDR